MVDQKKTFEEWLAEAEWPTPEESAQIKANLEATEGKRFETVTMQEDRSLFLVTIQYFVGGGTGEGSSESRPGDPNYEELLHAHGRLVPGQSHTLIRKMIDGKWTILPESDEVIPYRKNETKTA